MPARPRRRSRTAIALLAIGALSCAAWVRSHSHGDTLMYSTPSHRLALGWVPGSLVLLSATEYSKGAPPPTWIGNTVTTFTPTGLSLSGPRWVANKVFPSAPEELFWISGEKDCLCTTLPPDATPFASRSGSGFVWAKISYVRLPFWLLAVPPLLLGAFLLLPGRRRLPDHCSKCGYDLRASPDRCPECGTAVPAAAQ